MQVGLAPGHLEDLHLGAFPASPRDADVLRPDADLDLLARKPGLVGSRREDERAGP